MIFKPLFKSCGFSLVEMLTTVGIISILGGIAVSSYVSNYKQASLKAAMKNELSELSKYLNYTHSVDGGYHHNIYTMGYKPSKTLVANAGFSYKRGKAPACSIFPQAASGNFSPFLTITKDAFKAGKVDSATRSEHICAAGYCTITNKVVAGKMKRQNFSSGHPGCKQAFGRKSFGCNCDEFIIFAQSQLDSSQKFKMFTNQDGIFGYSDKNKHIDLLEK